MKPRLDTPATRPAIDDPLADRSASSLRHDELTLARSAAAGDAIALAALDRMIARTGAALRRLGLADPQRDDVLQELRLTLLVAAADGSRGIGKYAGTGSLVGWITVCAVNLARRRAGQAMPHAPADPDPAALSATTGDLELEYMQRLYGAEFKLAFEEAFADLSRRQRNLLRYTVLEGLSAEQIAAIYHVHRTTIARELSRTRKDLAARTQELLAARLGVSASEAESVLVLINSHLHVTLERLVAG